MRPLSGLQKKQEQTGWLFLAPALFILGLVGLYPLLYTIGISFTESYMASGRPAKFTGIHNYYRLVADPEFWSATAHTVIFTVVSVTLEFLLGLSMALLLNSTFRGRGLVRAAMLIPWAIPTVVAARIWNYMLVDTYGVVNDILVTRTGLLSEKVAWLAQPGLALFSIILVDVWKTAPFVALLLLAGMQTIPRQLYESAQIDGASVIQRFFRITLPMLKPAILVTLVFRTLDAFRVFDVIWVLTRGQLGTESVASYTFRQMIDFRSVGFGSAASVALALMIAIFIAVYGFLLRDREAQS